MDQYRSDAPSYILYISLTRYFAVDLSLNRWYCEVGARTRVR